MKQVRKSASIGNRSFDELASLMQRSDPIRTPRGDKNGRWADLSQNIVQPWASHAASAKSRWRLLL